MVYLNKIIPSIWNLYKFGMYFVIEVTTFENQIFTCYVCIYYYYDWNNRFVQKIIDTLPLLMAMVRNLLDVSWADAGGRISTSAAMTSSGFTTTSDVSGVTKWYLRERSSALFVSEAFSALPSAAMRLLSSSLMVRKAHSLWAKSSTACGLRTDSLSFYIKFQYENEVVFKASFNDTTNKSFDF